MAICFRGLTRSTFPAVIVLVALAQQAGAGQSVAGREPASNPEVKRIRPTDDLAEHLIQQARASSETVDTLFRELQSSDVVVYVTVSRDAQAVRGGSLKLIGCSGGHRFLMVRLETSSTAWPTSPVDVMNLIGTLAHELEHASEVSRDTACSAREFETLFRTIGTRTGRRTFETARAKEIEERVRMEFRGVRDGTPHAVHFVE